jgi:hypothetical protein
VHGRTRAEVARKLAELRAKLATGYPLLAERLTLEEFVGRWLEMVRPNLRPASWRCYSRNLALHVLPHLGRVRLQDLSPVHLRLLLAKWEELGTGAVVRAKTWRTLHKVLQDALRMELVARNPADAVPGPREKRPEIRRTVTTSTADSRSPMERPVTGSSSRARTRGERALRAASCSARPARRLNVRYRSSAAKTSRAERSEKPVPSTWCSSTRSSTRCGAMGPLLDTQVPTVTLALSHPLAWRRRWSSDTLQPSSWNLRWTTRR